MEVGKNYEHLFAGKSVAIVLNGEKYRGEIAADVVAGVDGGYNKAPKSDIFVGDKDSVIGDIRCVEQILLNVDKDETDGEFATRLALENGAKSIDFYGVLGGRIDHILANLGLLYLCCKRNVSAVAHCNDCDIYMVNAHAEIPVKVGATISLSPFTDEVHIMYLKGVRWGLSDDWLQKSSSRTVSNIATDDKISLNVASGAVMVIINK